MPVKLHSEEILHIPEGVTVTQSGKTFTVKGTKGQLTRSFENTQLEFHLNEHELKAIQWFPRGKQNSIPKTVCSHIKNMITGVTIGFCYKMRLCYAHFPITAVIGDKNEFVEIRNFMRENIVRHLVCPQNVKVCKSNKTKDELIITGIDVEAVSSFCANIHDSCSIKNKDLRKFLDGVYVSQSGTQAEVDPSPN